VVLDQQLTWTGKEGQIVKAADAANSSRGVCLSWRELRFGEMNSSLEFYSFQATARDHISDNAGRANRHHWDHGRGL